VLSPTLLSLLGAPIRRSAPTVSGLDPAAAQPCWPSAIQAAAGGPQVALVLSRLQTGPAATGRAKRRTCLARLSVSFQGRPAFLDLMTGAATARLSAPAAPGHLEGGQGPAAHGDSELSALARRARPLGIWLAVECALLPRAVGSTGCASIFIFLRPALWPCSMATALLHGLPRPPPPRYGILIAPICSPAGVASLRVMQHPPLPAGQQRRAIRRWRPYGAFHLGPGLGICRRFDLQTAGDPLQPAPLALQAASGERPGLPAGSQAAL